MDQDSGADLAGEFAEGVEDAPRIAGFGQGGGIEASEFEVA